MTMTTVGREISGDPARLDTRAADWWRPFHALVKERLGINLGIIQAQGGYSGSAGTHADGWAVDIDTLPLRDPQIMAVVALARDAGAAATWYRTTVGSGPHIHLVIPTTNATSAAAYQDDAARDGYDGLGYLGRANRDPHPRPDNYRDRAQGITWLTNQLEGQLPVKQDDFNKLMNAWATSKAGKEAISVAAQDATYGIDTNKDKKTDTVGQLVRYIAITIDRIAKKVGA